MTDDDNSSLRKRRRVDRFDDVYDDRGLAFREIFTRDREGPLRPRPSGKGGGPMTSAPPVLSSVWSAADAAANGVTLSNGGLTANVTAASLHNAWQILRASTSKISGKLYIEFKTSTGQTGSVQIGMASSGVNISDYLGNSNYSCGCNTNNGIGFVSTGFVATFGTGALGSFIANDVISLAVDFTATKIWVAKNNVWTAGAAPDSGANPNWTFTPATVGALFPALAFTNGGSNAVWTIQPIAASQSYTPPAGFSAWG